MKLQNYEQQSQALVIQRNRIRDQKAGGGKVENPKVWKRKEKKRKEKVMVCELWNDPMGGESFRDRERDREVRIGERKIGEEQVWR